MPVRLLPLALLLAACTDAPAPLEPRSTAEAEALEYLVHVDGDVLADAFAALDAAGYTARLEGDAGRTAFAVPPGGAAEGEPSLRNVVAEALTADPPYLDPTAREVYRLSVLGDTAIAGAPFVLVAAARVDPGSELPIERVHAAVSDDGRVGAVTVVRGTRSALFDEDTRVTVALAPSAAGWVPRTVRTDTRTDVPLSEPRTVRMTWTVETVGGEPL